MVDKAGSVRKIKLRRGRAVEITCPCVIILPDDSRTWSVVHDVILLADGEIKHMAAPIDDRPRKAR